MSCNNFNLQETRGPYAQCSEELIQQSLERPARNTRPSDDGEQADNRSFHLNRRETGPYVQCSEALIQQSLVRPARNIRPSEDGEQADNRSFHLNLRETEGPYAQCSEANQSTTSHGLLRQPTEECKDFSLSCLLCFCSLAAGFVTFCFTAESNGPILQCTEFNTPNIRQCTEPS